MLALPLLPGDVLTELATGSQGLYLGLGILDGDVSGAADLDAGSATIFILEAVPVGALARAGSAYLDVKTRAVLIGLLDVVDVFGADQSGVDEVCVESS